MMKVAHAFKTPIRRFSVGMVVTPADIDGPMAFEDWAAGGFIESDEPVAGAVEPVAAEPGAPAADDHTEA